MSQVLLCGDMQEIRSLTAPLIERLNIEVETLDTLEGFDTATLPEGFAERASTLRLASSIAVEPPPVNLLPVEATASRATKSHQRVVAVGTAAAVMMGAFLHGQARVTQISAERELDAVRREMSSLRAQTATANAVSPSESGLRDAFIAFDDQGPAMARVLETVGRAAQRDVTLRSLHVEPDSRHWNVSVDPLAASSDEHASRRAADRFLGALAASPDLGEPVQPPKIRFAPHRGSEIAASYRIRR